MTPPLNRRAMSKYGNYIDNKRKHVKKVSFREPERSVLNVREYRKRRKGAFADRSSLDIK
jgi:hypothetical protein